MLGDSFADGARDLLFRRAFECRSGTAVPGAPRDFGHQCAFTGADHSIVPQQFFKKGVQFGRELFRGHSGLLSRHGLL
jgi:hypothetical protein